MDKKSKRMSVLQFFFYFLRPLVVSFLCVLSSDSFLSIRSLHIIFYVMKFSGRRCHSNEERVPLQRRC